jgi:2-methylisoborneol synthase
MARFQHQMAILYTTLDQNASWRLNKQRPKVWEYLIHREHNSYLPPMILVDPLAGYELSPKEFYHPRVRRPVLMVGLAAVLLNDLHSAGKESRRLQPSRTDRRRRGLFAEGSAQAHR